MTALDLLPFRTTPHDLLAALDDEPGEFSAYTLGRRRASFRSIWPEFLLLVATATTLFLFAPVDVFLKACVTSVLLTGGLILGLRRGRYYVQLVIPFGIGFFAATLNGGTLLHMANAAAITPSTLTLLLAQILAATGLVLWRLHGALNAAVFEGLVVKNRNLARVDISACNLTGSTFEDVCLDGIKLDNVNLARASFVRVSANGATLQCTSLAGAGLADCTFARSQWLQVHAPNVRAQNCDLSGAIFKESRLWGARFSACNTTGTSFDAWSSKKVKFE